MENRKIATEVSDELNENLFEVLAVESIELMECRLTKENYGKKIGACSEYIKEQIADRKELRAKRNETSDKIQSIRFDILSKKIKLFKTNRYLGKITRLNTKLNKKHNSPNEVMIDVSKFELSGNPRKLEVLTKELYERLVDLLSKKMTKSKNRQQDIINRLEELKSLLLENKNLRDAYRSMITCANNEIHNARKAKKEDKASYKLAEKQELEHERVINSGSWAVKRLTYDYYANLPITPSEYRVK